MKQIFEIHNLQPKEKPHMVSNNIEAIQKSIKMKVKSEKYFYGYSYRCPCYNTIFNEGNKPNYCSNCGQALDWSEK